jgi:hypothetical protein
LPEVIGKGHVERLGLNVRFFKKHMPAHIRALKRLAEELT